MYVFVSKNNKNTNSNKHKEGSKQDQKPERKGGDIRLAISPQSFKNNVILFVAWLVIVIKLNIKMFQPQILICRRGNFVYHNWGDKLLSLETRHSF